ncbi:MAG: hypothetical protein JJU09_09275, partial [Rhodobacteraceae bacterium]|nr:hypothetical protein [Paracoccaceae bacterium]
ARRRRRGKPRRSAWDGYSPAGHRGPPPAPWAAPTAGETVLLAPAAASFDQYPDFEKRGDAFVAAVQAGLGHE